MTNTELLMEASSVVNEINKEIYELNLEHIFGLTLGSDGIDISILLNGHILWSTSSSCVNLSKITLLAYIKQLVKGYSDSAVELSTGLAESTRKVIGVKTVYEGAVGITAGKYYHVFWTVDGWHHIIDDNGEEIDVNVHKCEHLDSVGDWELIYGYGG